MKNKLIVSFFVILITVMLSGCCLKHEWNPATCTEPMTCIKCGKTDGAALGHSMTDATCTEPKTCSICGTTEGEALGHTLTDATCTEPKTCSICGATEGEALGHTMSDATCTEPKTCSVCGETEGEALGHRLSEATCTEPSKCTVCGEIQGEALGHSFKEATCTEPKTCIVCNATEGEPAGHVFTDATCTEPKKCTLCGVSDGKALGHKWEGGTCLTASKCSVCGLKGEMGDHSYDDDGYCIYCLHPSLDYLQSFETCDEALGEFTVKAAEIINWITADCSPYDDISAIETSKFNSLLDDLTAGKNSWANEINKIDARTDKWKEHFDAYKKVYEAAADLTDMANNKNRYDTVGEYYVDYSEKLGNIKDALVTLRDTMVRLKQKFSW